MPDLPRARDLASGPMQRREGDPEVTSVEMVDDVAHVFKGSRVGHHPAANCPCRPLAPLTSTGWRDPTAVTTDLFVHRFMPAAPTALRRRVPFNPGRYP